MNQDIPVGQNPLPYDASELVDDMIGELSERYDFINGQTAAYWHVCYALAQHLGKGKQ
jgi:hypothetical protein